MKKILRITVALCVLVFSGLAPASAAEAPLPDSMATEAALSGQIDALVASPLAQVTMYKYTVVNVQKTSNWTNKALQIGLCKVAAGAGGGRCTISNTYTVGTSIQTSLGIGVADVAANLGFSATKTVSGTIAWTSGVAPVGSSFKAWATGTRATYQVQYWKGTKVTGQTNVNWVLQSTSGTLTAFSPVQGFTVGQ
ncbi:hypothetical protein AAGW05_18110 [Arthrobacter sp. LAPM80]|uniref:hypothetical protein n=1 Tax=Arthrobacter sp. LAPM80 TaxID=3141788 RepID=UPI00398ACF5D